MANASISATLTAVDREAVLGAIATIKEKLPFLVDLSLNNERRWLRAGWPGGGDGAAVCAEVEPQEG